MGRRFGLRRLLLPDLGPILGLALGLGPGGASRPPLAIVAASVVAPFDSAICWAVRFSALRVVRLAPAASSIRTIAESVSGRKDSSSANSAIKCKGVSP